MKKILLATAFAGLTATAAAAEDWTGFFAGASLGYNDSLSDVAPGVHAGYRGDLGDLVLGGEVGYTFHSDDADEDRVSVEGTLGIDAGNVLPYASLGYAWGADANEGAVYGLGADLSLGGGNLIGAKATFDDFGANDTNFLVRYSFQF